MKSLSLNNTARILGLLILIGLGLHFFIEEIGNLMKYFPLKCPLNFLFSVKCPLHGLGHAVLAANHFNYKESISFHILGIPVYLYMLITAIGLSLLPQKTLAIHSVIIKKLRKVKKVILGACNFY